MCERVTPRPITLEATTRLRFLDGAIEVGRVRLNELAQDRSRLDEGHPGISYAEGAVLGAIENLDRLELERARLLSWLDVSAEIDDTAYVPLLP